MRYSIISGLLLSALCCSVVSGVAAPTTEAETQEQAAKSPDLDATKEGSSATETKSNESAEPRTVLQGGVKGSAIKLEQGLSLIDSSSKMLQDSALELAKECTRKETTVMRSPNYIGNGIVIPALGGNGSGIVLAGELPARKDKVEAFLSTAEDSMKSLRSHVDGLIIPEGSSEDMNNLWHGMQSSMKAAEENITNMREIVSQVPSKKGEIKQKDAKPLGRAAMKVYDSMSALTKMRNQLDDLLKPEIIKQ